jgi:hypothetical protein
MTNATPDSDQNLILARYSAQIARAVDWVHARTFLPGVEREDIHQEASILMLSYAGFLPSGRHHGSLAGIEKTAKEPKAVLQNQLKADLGQVFSRQEHWQGPEFDEEIHSPTPYGDNMGGTQHQIDWEREIPRLEADYPVLMTMEFRGRTEAEIAGEFGVTVSAIKKRRAAERAKAQQDPFFWPLDKDGHPVKPYKAKAGLGLVA